MNVEQVMGPDDTYLIHQSSDVKTFWADPDSLALGACFQRAGQMSPPRVPVTEARHRLFAFLTCALSACADVSASSNMDSGTSIHSWRPMVV